MKIRKASGAAAAGAEASGLASVILKPIAQMVNGITTAIASIGITRNNNSAANIQSYWTNRSELKTDNNLGFYIIVGLIILAAVIAIIVKSPKSK